jgi:uncharacterized protein YdhG (YjbR/CyaY superfamily)
VEGQTRGFQTIDEYIASFPSNVQLQLETMRATIHAAAPDAEECISYAMPAFAQNGNVVYFAALKNHIGFYPRPSAIEAFAQETTGYVSTKGALRFPLGEPLPVDLITRIVQFRVAENLQRASAKGKKRSAASAT